MKILIITGGFFPGVKCGGPPVSINNFCSLMEGHDCYIVAKNHDMGETEPYNGISEGWNDRGNCKVKYLSDAEYSKRSFAAVMDEIVPDVLYLQSLFHGCTIPCLSLAKDRGISVLLAPRGELCPGAMKKKYKKVPYIAFLKTSRLIDRVSFQYTSRDELEGIRKYFGNENRCFGLMNVPSRPTSSFPHGEKRTGTAKLVFLSRIVPKKNLMYAIERVSGLRGSIAFDVFGPIEDKYYFNECMKLADSLDGDITVSYRGTVGQGEAASVFSQYDCFLFPTFSENYGHVIAEALSSGCIVLTSDKTPWTFEGFSEAGRAINLNDELLWKASIQEIVDANEDKMFVSREAARRYFHESTQFDKLREKYEAALTSICAANHAE